MMVIGVAGGVASGKSLVSENFRSLGACVLDADRLGHDVLRDQEVQEAIRDRWGAEVFHSDGNVDRKAVATIVFGKPPGGPQELAYLESLTHPRIEERLRVRIERLREMRRFAATVLDAAVMFKAGWDKLCDQIVFVDASRETRLRRAVLRGWTPEQFAARESAQESVEKKRQRADIVIDNSGTPKQTFQQVAEVWRSLFQ